MLCCEKERDTPFCAECGKPLFVVEEVVTLLGSLEYYSRTLAGLIPKLVKTMSDGDGRFDHQADTWREYRATLQRDMSLWREWCKRLRDLAEQIDDMGWGSMP